MQVLGGALFVLAILIPVVLWRLGGTIEHAN
jgi:hypothetical protein